MPKDKRLEKKLEIQRAHFSLGSDANSKLSFHTKLLTIFVSEMPSKSYGQELIQTAAGNSTLDAAQQTSQVENRKKAVENSRKNNFNFGDDPNENVTSSAIAYTNKLGMSKSN